MKVLVYGFYHQGNLGDDLFTEAFQYLFPHLDLHFTDHLDAEQLADAAAIFFGGGSMLLGAPNITDTALSLLDHKKVFYLGVGVEAEIHPVHLQLMRQAQLLAIRSPDQVERVRNLNPHTRLIPDLVYALQSQVQLQPKIDKSVLILPNITVVPQGFDPHWKHVAWSYFKSEFSQFMDWLVECGYDISLFSMCNGAEYSDEWTATELIGFMQHRAEKYLMSESAHNIGELTALFSRYSTIITQRFHGIVLAEMTNTPYLAIHHHDKIGLTLPNRGTFLSYYSTSKRDLMESFTNISNYPSNLLIESNLFETLRNDVMTLIGE